MVLKTGFEKTQVKWGLFKQVFTWKMSVFEGENHSQAIVKYATTKISNLRFYC